MSPTDIPTDGHFAPATVYSTYVALFVQLNNYIAIPGGLVFTAAHHGPHLSSVFLTAASIPGAVQHAGYESGALHL